MGGGGGGSIYTHLSLTDMCIIIYTCIMIACTCIYVPYVHMEY